MLYRLALAWGVPNPEDLGDMMTPEELNGWIAYYQQEPWGDLQRAIARQTSWLCRVNGARIPGDLDVEELCLLPGGRYRGLSYDEVRQVQGLRGLAEYNQSFLSRK